MKQVAKSLRVLAFPVLQGQHDIATENYSGMGNHRVIRSSLELLGKI